MEQSLEQIVAENLAQLRKEKKWTQAELAEKINYSDKSVSKWERGDGLPDLKVLVQLADLYDVTLDCLVTANGANERRIKEPPKARLSYRIILELLAVSVVFLIATVLYVGFATYQKTHPWTLFIWALPISFGLLTLFNLKWKYFVCSIVFASICSWSLLTALYLQMLSYNLWMLFLIGIPAQAAVILVSQVRKRSRESRRDMTL